MAVGSDEGDATAIRAFDDYMFRMPFPSPDENAGSPPARDDWFCTT
jgi:hypothetical protein